MRAYISLGSNLGQPLQQMNSALEMLEHIPNTKIIRCSSFYRSKPLGPNNQPDFLNAVIELDTVLLPEHLLNYMQVIERHQGYIPKIERWGPRLLDLDLILYGNQIINNNRLIIPHYGLKEREFMLYPLAEIAPNIVLPDGELIETCLRHTPLNGMVLCQEYK